MSKYARSEAEEILGPVEYDEDDHGHGVWRGADGRTLPAGDLAECGTCGATVDAADNDHVAEDVNGSWAYFCGEDCQGEFMERLREGRMDPHVLYGVSPKDFL